MTPRQTQTAPDEFLEKELTGIIIGAFYETYNVLDFGFLESVYKSALACELRDRGLHFRREVPVLVYYKRNRVGWHRVDLLVEGKIVVELKATILLAPTDRRQVINYLRGTKLDVGLLLHYGPEPEVHRLVSPRLYREHRSR